MGLGTPAVWRKRHRAEPDYLRTRSLSADARDVVWSLLTLVALPCSHHASKILQSCRFIRNPGEGCHLILAGDWESAERETTPGSDQPDSVSVMALSPKLAPTTPHELFV